MTKWLILIAVLFMCSVTAESFKLNTLKVGATTYSNVTVLGANTTDLYFSHAHGFANVKLKYLPADLQKRFDYNPKAAEEAEKRQTENELLYQAAISRSVSARSSGPTNSAPKPLIGSETGLADPISDKSLLGKSAPALEVTKWLGEKPVAEGKFLLISFWATWSMPCRQVIPEFNALQKKYAEKLVVVGITAEPENDVTEMTEPRIEYPVGIDSKAKLTAAAGVTSVPCVLLADPKGTVLYQGHPSALTEKKLQTLLARPTEQER